MSYLSGFDPPVVQVSGNASLGNHYVTLVIHSKLLYLANTCRNRMGAKRFKDQILTHILKTCDGEGKSKTQVVYASGLNFKTIIPYLATLNKNELIEIISGDKTTQKGKEALIHLIALEKLIPIYISEEDQEACEEGVQI